MPFEAKASAGRWNRSELSRLLDHLRKDDVLVAWKLERLSLSLKDVLTLMEAVEKTGAGFLRLTEAVDTTSPAGRMMLQIVGSFAEFERAMLRERTRSDLLAAPEEGRLVRFFCFPGCSLLQACGVAGRMPHDDALGCTAAHNVAVR